MSSAIPIAQHLAAENDATHKLTRIWEDLLSVRPIEPDQNYFDLGGDSLLAVQMFGEIDKVFQVKIPVATLFEAPTIAELVQILNREAPSSRWSSLVTIQPKGARPPLFCMHGAGGNVLIYRELSKRLGDDQPFYGLQSQGLDGDCEPPTRIEDMATDYVREICRIQPTGPYYLAGYCLGGTIAYEVAQQLRAAGKTVALLALFDTLNWCKVPPLTLAKKASVAVERVIFHSLNYLRLDRRGKREFLREKIQVLRNRIPVWRGTLQSRMAGTSDGTGAQSVVLGKIWAANDQAAIDYIPKPFPGVVTDFRPLKQYSIYQRSDLKWEELAKGGQHIVPLPVYPAGMMVEPFVGVLAEALKKSIDSATP
ncbi:MAG: alpha/beta fold hydrolase [Candidatus Acidiferrum sp.]|jgi:phthiocerol/phenolphthiocerol synthesis type-I polyketide synthase E